MKATKVEIGEDHSRAPDTVNGVNRVPQPLLVRACLLGACLLMCGGLLFAGLWPFEFYRANEMQWVGEADGLRSGRSGIAYTREALPLVDAVHDAFSIEIAGLSDGVSRDGIRRMISIMGPDRTERLFIGQWDDDVLVRFRSRRISNIFQEIGADSAFSPGKPVHLIVSYRQGAVSLFADGVSVVGQSPIPLASLNGILIIGNAPNGASGWIGQINALRISHEPISGEEATRHYLHWLEVGILIPEAQPARMIAQYAFSEGSGRIARNLLSDAYALTIPDRMNKRDLQILHLPFDEIRLNKGYIFDVILNSLGFIPFGFSVFLFLLSFRKVSHRNRLLLTTASGGLISLAIEVLQALTLNRSSQLSDLILNTLGTLAGAILCLLPLLLYARKERPAEQNASSDS